MIPLFKVYMASSAASKVADVLNSGYIGQGPKVDQFEAKLKEVLQNDYVVTTNSATSAEHLAIHLLKNKSNFDTVLNDGDEILATPLTCTASNWPILANNAKIKWVDVDPNNLNMDLDDLARKISPTTKAIMVVHWGGYPVDLAKLAEICDKAKAMYGFRPIVIEDCAHAFGSTYQGMPLGSVYKNMCTYSFQAIKHLTSVDGGVLVLPNNTAYDKAKLLRWYGIDRESNRKDFRCEADIEEWGFKFHMNDVCATVGLANLEEVFTNVIDLHRDNARYYDSELTGIDNITLLENKPDRESAAWLYTFKVNKRDSFMKFMTEKGISTSRVHERNDKHTCVAPYISQLPSLEKVVNEMICIPVGWWVDKKDREYIVQSIKEWASKNK